MHGLIHIVLKSFVVEEFGAGKWEEVVEELGLADDAVILQMKYCTSLSEITRSPVGALQPTVHIHMF